MTPIITTEYGRKATETLARAVDDAKSGDPLAPVTVVVPSNFAGLVARRRLGLAGIANVHFLTPFRFAELLAVPVLGGKRPLTNPVLGAAVRRVLSIEPRHFRRVRGHHATEHAIAMAVGELSNVGDAGLEAIATEGSRFGAAMVELHRSVVALLGDFHDEADVARAAAGRADLAEALEPYGHVIWYLPGQEAAPLAAMVGAIMRHSGTVAIVGRSGDEAADREVFDTLSMADIDASAANVAPVDAPLAHEVVSVTDADEEVRHVVRSVIELLEAGTPLDRIGIFHPVPDPYVRILEHQFEGAGLAANGPSRRRLDGSVAGRTLLAALRLDDERWRRDRVIALVTDAPIRDGDGSARPATWDRISREAGVVGGLHDWRRKLRSRAERGRNRQAELLAAGDETRALMLERDIADATALEAFVDRLAAAVAEVSASTSWQELSGSASRLLRDLLGPANRHGHWPEPEQEAFERVEAVLVRLASLDTIDPEPSLPVFRRALEAELSVARERNGRFGLGAVYGPLSSAPGHDLDAVFILGCTEGLLPAPRRQDALLPDADRSLAGGELPSRLGRLHEQHRHFLAALASAPPDRRWLLYPRGDLRGGRQTRPSRWLLPSASRLAGRPLYGTDFEHGTPAGVTEVASHADAIRAASHPASEAEYDLASVLNHHLVGGDPVAHPSTAAVGQGLRMQRARSSSRFTEFDGNLAGQPIPSTADTAQSATRMETWAACGFRYFLSHLLDLSERDDPERTVQISPLDRGSAIHLILERFLDTAVADDPPAPDQPWSETQLAQAQETAGAVFADYEDRGRTGRPVTWAQLRSDLHTSIAEFLVADSASRRRHRSTPFRFEQAFGLDGAPPVEIALDDHRRLSFRGMIDRVDIDAEGGMLVFDYKTGTGSRYKGLESEDDPTRQGTLLQLGLYAEAAIQLLGAERVRTSYWIFGGAYEQFGYDWTDEHRDRLVEVLATIVDGIEAGVFAAAPGEWNSFRRTHETCTFCDYDALCPRDRAEHANDKAAAPELHVRVRLSEGPGSAEPDDPGWSVSAGADGATP